MVASDLDSQDNTFEQILDMLDEKVAIAEFPEIDEKELSGMALEKRSVNFVVNFYSAFGHFSNHDMQDKSINGHNCRKSSLLSQMLILHKLMLHFNEAKEET
jgi:hypothetical protein